MRTYMHICDATASATEYLISIATVLVVIVAFFVIIDIRDKSNDK